jgi:hydroxyethylthiazole kinase-like sugar kinase family protein
MSRTRRAAARKPAASSRTTSRKSPASRVKTEKAPWRAAANAAIRGVESYVEQAGELSRVGREVAAETLRSAREAVARQAAEARSRAVAVVSGLEETVADGAYLVAARIGVPTARDMRALSRQVARLQESVEKLQRPRARA